MKAATLRGVAVRGALNFDNVPNGHPPFIDARIQVDDASLAKLGDAADSPVVDDEGSENQVTGIVGLSYAF
ncbi:hypothetical protein [Marinivivus vitaminiproducens]|uniref:hypothetical protein n=1 Tax=Marinivivus vitaminiproducens TaxID=3035935 RepID=UPI002798F7A9|nr:hypothetical protein P4R82_01285 [Geminicoccaceae bacterium SCSIO 64248]